MTRISLTWNATANVRVEWKDKVIFFDPYYTRNEKADPKVNFNAKSVDNEASIFISHGHFDHLYDVPAILKEKDAVQVYCSEVAKETLEKAILKEHEMDAGKTRPCVDRVHAIHAGDVIEIHDGAISVEAIKSEHVKFDLKSIFRALFKWDVWKNIRTIARLGKNYPKGDVFGYDVNLGDEARLVMFGSLYAGYPELLKQHANPDIFLAPVAGRFNAGDITLEVVDHLRPKRVIPIHHDDFYPAITYWVPLEKLKEGLEKNYPSVKYQELPFEAPTTIEI